MNLLENQRIIDNHSPCYVGDAGVGMLAYMKQLLIDADLILALNVRFDEMTTAGYSLFDVPLMAATLIHSHASDAELGKIYIADLPLHAGLSFGGDGIPHSRKLPFA